MPRTRRLQLLDVGVRLITDDRALDEQVCRELGPFLVEERAEDEGPDEQLLRVEVRREPPPPRATIGGIERPLDPQGDPAQCFGLIFRALLDATRRFIVLHAAALEREGRALLIAGPSESGKTTLALALMERGFRLLSDDYAPIERRSGKTWPFTKALGVRPGPGRLLARLDGVPGEGAIDEAPAREALDATWRGEKALARRPAEVAGIVLLDGAPEPLDPRAPYLFGVRTTRGADELARDVAALDALELVDVFDDGVVLRLDPARGGASGLERVLAEHDGKVIEYGLIPRPALRRSGEPRLSRLSPSEALLLLARDTQNRRAGGALMSSLGGNLGRLTLEIARLVGSKPFYWLDAGDPRGTAAALEALHEELR